ncbi:MAG: hypothetical protein AB1631_05125 [Acidobacteriota bacterium]
MNLTDSTFSLTINGLPGKLAFSSFRNGPEVTVTSTVELSNKTILNHQTVLSTSNTKGSFSISSIEVMGLPVITLTVDLALWYQSPDGFFSIVGDGSLAVSTGKEPVYSFNCGIAYL